MAHTTTSTWGLLMVVLVVGCSPQPEAGLKSEVASQYIASSEPAEAMPVGTARAEAKDGAEIALVGHIGGSTKPFVDGAVAFTIVDPNVPYCAPDEGCPTPWDYCCTQNDVKDNIAMVKLVDESGNTVTGDARRVLGVEELSLVVVQGVAQRDEAGNLTLLAEKVYVRK